MSHVYCMNRDISTLSCILYFIMLCISVAYIKSICNCLYNKNIKWTTITALHAEHISNTIIFVIVFLSNREFIGDSYYNYMVIIQVWFALISIFKIKVIYDACTKIKTLDR